MFKTAKEDTSQQVSMQIETELQNYQRSNTKTELSRRRSGIEGLGNVSVAKVELAKQLTL